ncbi:MAG: PilZ domain-containing protein [Deltaproteobacteria bacterium]|nr:PilZ domain-containing protein [Deltaproteobacteria bacterium]
MQPFARDDQRLDFRVDVDFLLNKYIDGKPYLCRATNISRCGLRVERVFEPKHGEEAIGLQFQLPGTDRIITCSGRIAHQAATDHADGITLEAVAPEHQEMIDDFILKRLDWAALI